MAQNYDDNAPAWGNPTDSDVAKIKNNFEALKSTFSGASQPPNPVAGMWWYDTTAHILKVRNEANNAWLSVWDLANNKPVIANLYNEITAAMIHSSLKSPAASVEGMRRLGTGATEAMPGNFQVPRGVQVFTASGTWIKPAGVSGVFVKIWGASGGGGAGGSALGGGGGGGGGYSEGLVNVTGNIWVTVGAGGAAGTVGAGGMALGGGDGGLSQFDVIQVTGGVGGGSEGGAGGAGGAGGGGQINLNGNFGSPGSSGGGGGGGAGAVAVLPAASGGRGGAPGYVPGSPGGPGKVIVYW